MYTNQDGNHILVHEDIWPGPEPDNEIKYYLFSYNGTLIRSTTILSGFNQDDKRQTKIYGYDDKIYISYRIGSYIYTKRSQNAGQSWSDMQTISMSEPICNGLEIWCDNNGLHITWSESVDDFNLDFDTYYKRLPHDESYWIDYKRVTDSSGEYGGSPSVTTSANRVHVAYTKGNELFPLGGFNDSKTRDKYYTTWYTPQNVASETIQNHIIADDTKLHMLYYENDGGLHNHADLYHKSRNLNSSTWSSRTLIEDGADFPYENPVDMSLSNNGNVNIAYARGSYWLLDYRHWDGNWSSAFPFGSGDHPKISANNDDLYFIWFDWNDNGLRLRQKDFNPLVPQNFSGSWNNNHPHISWDANSEADLEDYDVWKKIDSGSWSLKTTTTNTYYTDTSEDKYSIGHDKMYVYYKIKASDYNNNKSGFTSSQRFAVIDPPEFRQGLAKNNITIESSIPIFYQISQNFPNPFNPETNITFGIPEDNFVSLVVYNINGEKVATLVNEQLPAGIYTTQFDGASLPSGVYIYTIKAGSFSQIKRMLLIK